MKRLILFLFALFICSSALAQDPNTDYRNVFATFYRAVSNGTTTTFSLLQGRTVTDGSTDTTRAIEISDYKTVYVGIQATDTCTILIDYALSLDDSTWSTWTLIDSASVKDSTCGVKVFDFTSTCKGAKSVKFRFRGTHEAYALGDGPPKYKARYMLKKY